MLRNVQLKYSISHSSVQLRSATTVRKPNFFILGAPKCGTTALASYLREHPDVLMSEPKEPHFFSSDFPFGPSGLVTEADYLDQCFGHGGAVSYRAIGEASVWYLCSEEAVQRIVNFDSNARFIVMVRNPIEMAFSLHTQHLVFGWEPERDFVVAIRADKNETYKRLAPLGLADKIVRTCVYRDVCRLSWQIERLFHQVPRDRVLIIVYDDLAKGPGDIYRSTLAFLNLDDDNRTHFPRVNAARRIKSRFVAQLLRTKLAVNAAITVKSITGIRSLGFGRPAPFITPREYRASCEVFYDDIMYMSQLIGRDCSSWFSVHNKQGVVS